ncbi:hypothetical protein B296_00044829 [Ensete ventricosum]|uniref:Uncharacterized protein n=1 Tax=Ensete ventricosum TaxID=4639 RepID=A0A426XEJ1_ENSVE|nr:hypothetical protein B296_00044829 [Ensete ventricosum]
MDHNELNSPIDQYQLSFPSSAGSSSHTTAASSSRRGKGKDGPENGRFRYSPPDTPSSLWLPPIILILELVPVMVAGDDYSELEFGAAGVVAIVGLRRLRCRGFLSMG